MKSLLTATLALTAFMIYVCHACETRYVWKEAWTDSCNGKELTYNAISKFKGMGKWRMEQKQNGAWTEVGTPSFNRYDESSEWYWVGDPSGKLHVTTGGTTGCLTGHFDEPSPDNYKIKVMPTGNSKQQKYKAPAPYNNLGDVVSTPSVEVTVKH